VSRDPIDQRHFTTQELADFLRVHPETIRREAARGRLRSIRVGSERRYPESAVKEYMERNQRGEDAA
jgi:excisionase family DNA binding protein